MYEMKILPNNRLEEIENNQSQCDVCLKETSVENTDEIVMCDLCNCAVHQQCYRRELEKGVPAGNWFCERCMTVMKQNKRPTDIRCLYCDDLTGVIISVKSKD